MTSTQTSERTRKNGHTLPGLLHAVALAIEIDGDTRVKYPLMLFIRIEPVHKRQKLDILS
jgi:hypothetical protein